MLVLEIIGNLGSDAVIKDFNGQKFISFSVAHTESYVDKELVKHEKTTWVSCLKYGESGVLPYLKKGTRVFVRGD
jgi:single-strand DNA-binding protein